MSEALRLALCAVAGFALGAGYFAGLWWTVRNLNQSAAPGALVLVSFLLRNALLAAGFVVVSGRTWQGVVACLLGFVAARLLVVRALARRIEPPAEANDGEGGQTHAGHAR